MRILVAAALLTAGTARAQTPPSNTLVRAIKLYDKKDFYSATVELKKVLDGESGDDAANKQRAEFFMGKAVLGMHYPAVALAYLDHIAVNPQHQYHVASLKWVVAAYEAMPGITPQGAISSYDAAIDAPEIDDTARDGYRYYRGREHLRGGDQTAGLDLLRRIPEGSRFRTRAALEIASRAQRVEDAIAEVRIAARDPATADDAVGVLVTLGRALGTPAKTRETLAGLARTNARAKLELARLDLEARGAAGLARISVEGFDAVAIATGCTQGATLRSTLEDLRAGVERIAKYDDNAEVFAAVKRFGKSPAITLALGDRATREARAWTAELAQEIRRLEGADPAWKTTQVAMEIQQELIVQLSVGEADAGKLALARITKLAGEMSSLGAFVDAVQPSQLAVGDALCSSALGMPARVATQPAQPIATPQPRATGCAGCSSGSGAGWLVALAIAIGARRRATR